MTKLAAVLKSEVARLARKELRAEADGLKKVVQALRSEIASLKRRVQGLERELRTLSHQGAKRAVAPETQDDGEAVKFRFRAAGLASNRKRLGLSAEDFGLLVGTTGQSIYAWESGRSKPRPQNLAALAALRQLGKREVMARLAALAQKR